MDSMSHQNPKKKELADIAYKCFEWIRNNRQQFYSISGIVLGVILFAAFFFTRYFLVKERVSDKLSLAQALIYQNQTDQGVRLLDEIIGQYSNTPSASIARLTKADFLINQHKYSDAKDIVSKVMNSGKPDTVIPLAYPFMGNIEEDTQDYKGAIGTYNDFLTKYPDHFLVPDILQSLGRVCQITGAYDQAKAAYQRLATEFKGSRWEQNARENLFVLNNANLPGKK